MPRSRAGTLMAGTLTHERKHGAAMNRAIDTNNHAVRAG